MPENEKPVNIHWLVRVAGCDEELLVYAAYVQYNVAGSATATVHAIGGRDEPFLATFKNADHKVVFQAPAAAVAYVRRADVTDKVDRNATPNQLRDMKDGLAAAAAGESTPAQTMFYTTNVAAGVPGAAGVPQVFTLNVPAGGMA
jgi:hypothetical protein